MLFFKANNFSGIKCITLTLVRAHWPLRIREQLEISVSTKRLNEFDEKTEKSSNKKEKHTHLSNTIEKLTPKA